MPDIVIQRILRHANVSTTASYCVKSAADDVPKAMAKLENQLAVTGFTPEAENAAALMSDEQRVEVQ